MKLSGGFLGWVAKNKFSRVELAEYFMKTIPLSPPNSFFWDILEVTGDKTYNGGTFLKAADLVIGQMEENNK